MHIYILHVPYIPRPKPSHFVSRSLTHSHARRGAAPPLSPLPRSLAQRPTASKSRKRTAIWARLAASATRLKSRRKGSVASALCCC
jgi:hypothetical protein